jgi:hypothetical protein
MLKLLAIVVLVSGAAVYSVAAAAAPAMSMPEDSAPTASHPSADVASEAIQDDSGSTGPLRETVTVHDSRPEIATHAEGMHATNARTDHAHPAIGTDAAAAHKNHTGASWQSLLPGVMK